MYFGAKFDPLRRKTDRTMVSVEGSPLLLKKEIMQSANSQYSGYNMNIALPYATQGGSRGPEDRIDSEIQIFNRDIRLGRLKHISNIYGLITKTIPEIHPASSLKVLCNIQFKVDSLSRVENAKNKLKYQLSNYFKKEFEIINTDTDMFELNDTCYIIIYYVEVGYNATFNNSLIYPVDISKPSIIKEEKVVGKQTTKKPKKQPICKIEPGNETVKKQKKQTISKTLKQIVWANQFGKKGCGLCPVCKTNEITPFIFHCGHKISEKNGGNIEPSNLIAICSLCNGSMGSTNYDDFMCKNNLS